MSIRVSIVVPTWNRRDTLAHVLPTLLSQSCGPSACEILVCTRESTDGTAELISSFGAPNLELVHAEAPGRSGARNAGIRRARGPLVLFTDADILADPRLVENHLAAHERHGRCAVVGWEVQVDSLVQHREMAQHPERRTELHRPTTHRLSWLFFLTGNASVPRDAVEKAGGFDDSFTGYGHEDLELGYRLQRAGLPIIYYPAAVNYHWHPHSLDERRAKMRLAGSSTIRFYQKHRDWRILARLGVNPFSLAWHGLLAEHGPVMQRLRALAPTSRACRAIVLQHAYLTGVKEARAAAQGGGVTS